MGSIGIYSKVVKSIMPVLMRWRIFFKVAERDGSLVSERIFVKVQFVLLCGLAVGFSPILGFLVERPASIQ